jgi:signal transduction histidine kinase
MNELGSFLNAFLTNISIIMLFMYIASLVYKYFIYRCSSGWREALFVVLAILAGWTTMHYGFRFSETVIFDLRFMTVIMAPIFVRRPLSVLLIGIGVGLARLSFGINHASIVGCANVVAMSLICIGVMWFAARKQWGFYTKMTAIILTVNTMNIVFIALFGVIPAKMYLLEMAPGSFVISLLLGFIFVFILRDYIIEASRKQELEINNERLERQYRISEEKSNELLTAKSELEKKNEQVMQASRYKSDFLANMSHELRTPLNSMLVLSQMLEENTEGRLSKEELRYVNIIHSSGLDLLAIINEVLDMSKIEAGRMELNDMEFNVNELLQVLRDAFAPLANQKNIAFAIDLGESVTGTMVADIQRLQQILRNMIANALKFTDNGRVDLSVYCEDRDRDGAQGANSCEKWIVFAVSDTGIGIPQHKQASVFEAFYQADSATSRTYGGTGLGLSISRQFAELMGGSIDLESTEGQGSRFTLYLPLRPAAL